MGLFGHKPKLGDPVVVTINVDGETHDHGVAEVRGIRQRGNGAEYLIESDELDDPNANGTYRKWVHEDEMGLGPRYDPHKRREARRGWW